MTDTADISDARAIMDGLRRIVQALRKASTDSTGKSGLTAAQTFLLRTLQAHAGASVNDLATLTRTHQSSVSEVISRLEEKGLVDRRPAAEDRRRVELRLTPAGEALVNQHGRTPQEEMLEAIDTLPPETRKSLAQGLRALAAAVSPAGETPPLFFEDKDAP
jgi:DNA-binding MarR family transcriptional regulator